MGVEGGGGWLYASALLNTVFIDRVYLQHGQYGYAGGWKLQFLGACLKYYQVELFVTS